MKYLLLFVSWFLFSFNIVAQENLTAEEAFRKGYEAFIAENNEEGLKWTLIAAEKGFANAQYLLGAYYEFQTNSDNHLSEAVKWYRKAAEQGLADAQTNLASCYFQGKGVGADPSEGVKWLLKAAEQGNVIAQYNLGLCFSNGFGVPRNYTEAARWFQNAASQGYAEAQNEIGYCYEHGRGVQRLYTVAAIWYRRAAEQGLSMAQYNIGICLLYGQGVKKNPEEALKWFRLSADQGHEMAQVQLEQLESGISFLQTEDMSVSEQRKERRIAFVIGNSDYKNSRPLPNAKNDAINMALKLKQLGFDVLPICIDLQTRQQMTDSINSFCQRARGYDVALFFYAGHGCEYIVNDTTGNYLVPTGIGLQTRQELRDCIKLDYVLAQIMRTNAKRQIVLLDACRSNMFQAISGEIKLPLMPPNMFVAYSTQSGDDAYDINTEDEKHSPFTSALLKALDEPLLAIDNMFIQVEEKVSNMTNNHQRPDMRGDIGNFYFNLGQ